MVRECSQRRGVDTMGLTPHLANWIAIILCVTIGSVRTQSVQLKDIEGEGCFSHQSLTSILSKETQDFSTCFNVCHPSNYVGITDVSGCYCINDPPTAENKVDSSLCPRCTDQSEPICGNVTAQTIYVYKYKDCEVGKYGMGCPKDCSCANGDACHRSTGHCTNGCAAGYRGQACSDSCLVGTFGASCNLTCHCANASSCHTETGICDNEGCTPGYQLSNCQQACQASSYGPNCASTCTNCDDLQCHHIEGCKQCAAGYQSPPACSTSSISTPASDLDETGSTVASTTAGMTDLEKYVVPAMGGVAGLLVLILIILICVFVHRKRSQKKLKPDGFDELVPPADGGIKSEQNSSRPWSEATVNGTVAPSGDDYDLIPAVAPHDYKLAVTDLEAHIKKIREQETTPFKEEYDKIPEGQTSPWEFGIHKNVHRDKNRFGNIVAYDHSRVVLTRKKDDASEYINANFIDGYKQPKAFIATQGPMPQTVDDFWRMCWEHNVPIIVMVTNCVENGRLKSEQYWPDVGETKTVGEYIVHAAEEERFSDFVIRTMNFKKDEETRKIKQFQFTGWPDHGVPRQATPLLTLRRRVRAEMGIKAAVTGPTIVHCSAGVGRSGTFIAVDYLKNQAEAEGVIDVFKCVWGMRYQRVNMVQTWDQYNFIYDALLEAVTVGETTIPCYEFSEIYPQWLIEDPVTKITKLEQQLRVLDVVKQKQPDNEMEPSMKTINRNKNRNQDILPANYYRACLQTRVEGTNDYINAVFVQGYYKREAFLVTQAPLPDTRVDFWRMVYDFECHSVICLEDYKRTDAEEGKEGTEEDESMPSYWPEGGTMIFGPIIITFVKTSTDQAGITMTELTLTIGKNDKDVRQVTIFSVAEFKVVDDEPLPDKVQIALKEAVKKTQQKHEDKTVVIMCKYGVERCGLYCALDYVIDMMEVEQEVDVFQAVRQVQMSRPQLVQNIEQYKFLYEAAKTYMEINMAYANFQ